MPKRVRVEREISVEVRGVVAQWIEWLIRRERLTYDEQATKRLTDLERLLEAVRDGVDVEINGGDLPGSLNVKPDRTYRLCGDRLIEY